MTVGRQAVGVCFVEEVTDLEPPMIVRATSTECCTCAIGLLRRDLPMVLLLVQRTELVLTPPYSLGGSCSKWWRRSKNCRASVL